MFPYLFTLKAEVAKLRGTTGLLGLTLSSQKKGKVRGFSASHSHSPVPPRFSPTGRRFPPSVFYLMSSFWHASAAQQNELLHPYGTEQPAPRPGLFCPQSRVTLVAWHQAVLLGATIPTQHSPTAVISTSNVGSASSGIAARLHYTWQACQRALEPLWLAPLCLFHGKPNFQVNTIAWQKRLCTPFHPKPFSIWCSFEQASVSATLWFRPP